MKSRRVWKLQMTTRRNINKAESESTRVTVISGVDRRGALHSTCKSEKVTEGIMTSLRYLTCLFLLTVSLTDLSKAGCRDQFTKNAWKKNLTDHLPDYISIQMDRKPEDVMECSIKNTVAEPTLEDCFEDNGDCEGKSNSSTPVIYLHLMCLTHIAMNLTENEEAKTIAAGVCKVYEKVCEPFLQSSSTPAPKMTSSTAATTTTSPATSTTATAPPSSPKMTTPTSSKATATTASPETSTTTTAPPSSPKMTTPTSSKATATTASPETSTTTAPPSSPKMTTPTSSKATATTASPETATSTSSTATTVSLATPTTESVTKKPAPSSLSAPGKSDKNIGACATNKTDIFKLQIVIAFLIFTNVLGPLAVYMYMRRQRNKESFNVVNRNISDTVQMTIQPQTVVQIEDSGEGAVLLKTSQCSVIINPPETTQTEKLCQNGLAH